MTGQASEESFLTPSPALPLRGDEQFTGVDATVIDFWRWAFSDLRDNTTRGILAEFLVSKAVGDAREMRIGWGNFDALAPDGTKIEVKCSAFLQSWTLQRLSGLQFGRLRAREFDADRNELSADVRVRADVFVFAVQAQQDPASYDMLDIGHWEFWVASADAVRPHLLILGRAQPAEAMSRVKTWRLADPEEQRGSPQRQYKITVPFEGVDNNSYDVRAG